MSTLRTASMFVVLLLLTSESLAQRVATGSILYDDDRRFEQLSGSAQTALESRYGKRAQSPQQRTSSNQLSVEDDAQIPVYLRPEPLSIQTIANTLVNNAAADATSQDTQSETSLVLGTGTTIIAGFNDSGNYNASTSKHFTGFSVSTNSGTNWTDMGSLPTTTEGDAGDPVFARDNTTGTIYFATLGLSPGENMQIFRSTDNGTSFLAPVSATPGFTGTGDFQDKEWLAVDNFAGAGQGNVYHAWRHFQNTAPGSGLTYGIRFTRSTDGGATWIPNQGTLIASQATFNVQGAWVAVGPDHSVYVFWLDQSAGSGTANIIKMSKSTDAGATFSAPSNVATLINTATNGGLGLAFRSNSFPQVAVNPVSGNLYVVYNDPTAVSGGDRGNIFFRQSTDGGTSWSSASQLNTDGTTTAQFMPAIGVTPDGSALCVAWYDRRNDATEALIQRFGVTATISGGTATFGSNFPISNQFPNVFGVDPVVNSTYMGDYDQVVADNSFFYTTWGDNRDNATFPGATRKSANVRFAKIPKAGLPATPVLDFVSRTLSGGNGNGSIDFNECNDLSVMLKNNGTGTATGVSATLSTTTSGVAITDPTKPYADIAPGASGSNTAPFKVSTSPGFVCGTTVNFTLTVTYTDGSDVHTFSLVSCECTGNSFVGSLTGSDPQQTSRLFRDGAAFASTCAALKTCPGTSGTGTRSYDAYGFRNTSASTLCITVNLTSGCGTKIFSGSYLNSFDPTNVCTNYRADAGASFTGLSTYSFNVAAGDTFVVVVNEVTAGAGCVSYTLAVTGLTCGTDGGGQCPPVPIQLASFTGRATSNSTALLEWRTASEVNNYGFEIQKAIQRTGSFTTIPGSFVPGRGTTLEPQYYQYTDANATPDARFYRLKQMDLDGSIQYFDPIHVSTLTGVEEKQIPAEFSLAQNYPNPFNPSTVIKYGLPANAFVMLEVFNALGQRVMVLVDEMKEAGYHQATLDGNTLASGVYFYKITAGSFVNSKKLLLIK